MTVISVVLFGSQVSGGSDDQSDKDLLVICEPRSKKGAIKMYSEEGYSVSVYTPRQLEFMQLQGSLFLQHLKHESKVLFDSERMFEKFISGCDLTPPSVEELERTKKSLINTLICPVGDKSSWWLADYLFVLSRDYFIKHFARKKRIIFNVIQLSREIEQEFSLSKSEINTFLALRRCKSLYRSRRFDGEDVKSILSVWCEVLSKILSISPVKKVSFNCYLFDRDICDFESVYALLRYVESLRIMLPNTRCGKEYECQVSKMIVSPNHYSSTSVNGKRFLSLYLTDFRKRASNSF